ncbi:MAG: hypothetical protein ACI9F9_002041, partial [Candidatus Paceibacteria bacterium]
HHRSGAAQKNNREQTNAPGRLFHGLNHGFLSWKIPC